MFAYDKNERPLGLVYHTEPRVVSRSLTPTYYTLLVMANSSMAWRLAGGESRGISQPADTM